MRTFSLLLPFVLLYLPVRPVWAQQDTAGVFTAREVVRRVLETYPTVEASQAAIAAAEARTRQAQSRSWPHLSVEGRYRRQDPVTEVSLPGGRSAFSIQPHNAYGAHLNLDYTLYDFGQTAARIDAAQAGRTVAAENVGVVKSTLAFQALQSFYTVLFLEARIRVQEQQIVQLEQAIEIARRRRAAGTATDFEVLSTQTRISAARSRVIDLHSRRQSREASLRRLMGLKPDAPLDLSGDLRPATRSPVAKHLLARALRRHPDVQAARAEVDRAAARVDVAASSDNPALVLRAQGGVQNGYPTDLGEPRLYQSVGVTLRVPLFDGFQTEAHVEETRANVRAAEARLQATKRTVAAVMEQAVDRLRADVEQLETNALQVEQANAAAELARRRYLAGTITNLDLLAAETERLEAQLQQTRVRYEVLIDQYSLRKATGTLLPFAEIRY